MYINFIEEYHRLGHMREVVTDDETSQQYFIPHHCIIKPESTTTKLRVVFDASCPSSTGVSLNDALMVGPTVQDDLISLILRFRFHRYALIADIEKMYRMVEVQQHDRRLQRIFWRNHPNEPIRVFELCTVTYGTASAPYLATKCLKRLAELDGAKFPDAAVVLASDFYVDDLMSGVDTTEDGVKLYHELTRLLKNGGITLRKWSSNNSTILDHIPHDMRDDRSSVDLESASTVIKTLGLVWEPRLDCFKFKVPLWNRTEVYKRTVLSDLARIFDRIGLISPIIIAAKIFVQDLWKQKLSWDDPLSSDLQSQWQKYRHSLIGLENLRIPRWLAFSKTCLSVELHGFCDASIKAYGACIYVRCTHIDGQITSNLLAAKSKVAPLDDQKRKKRSQTIPRLELSSALLLAHLYEIVSKSIRISARPFFLDRFNDCSLLVVIDPIEMASIRSE
ncbi:uncharacterized protein LOC129765719 [Toxorhynchites rutilus septentrionalis]|uniref:uncharacterized protein LOC129765719 n=1 Tax=Toxorhynchites rutilus septentrionalis TaxID=329112 RepID=UPI002478F0CD|nr:uncharacterized protein LOC129765719 [Toxorhynchites rutilus septentrionalis]